jgi:hypothetical protein
MPPTPLPEGLTWPGKSGQPSPGLVPSILAYIQLVNTRLPLLEYRGCHGIARVCYAAPYGATPEVGEREEACSVQLYKQNLSIVAAGPDECVVVCL